MSYLTCRLTDFVYTLAIWDEGWNAHNNCYLIRQAGGDMLIDCGKELHAQHLLGALAELGCQPEDIRYLVATHGHADHVGAAGAFPRTEKWIHPHDLNRLTPALQEQFTNLLPDQGRVLGLDCIHLGQHTAGSVAFFHPESGVLFCGDHICFFGGDLPPEGLVSPDPVRRQRWRELAAQLPGESADNRQKYSLDLFVPGVAKLNRYPARFLATGHGVVLAGEINAFLADVITAATPA